MKFVNVYKCDRCNAIIIDDDSECDEFEDLGEPKSNSLHRCPNEIYTTNGKITEFGIIKYVGYNQYES